MLLVQNCPFVDVSAPKLVPQRPICIHQIQMISATGTAGTSYHPCCRMVCVTQPIGQGSPAWASYCTVIRCKMGERQWPCSRVTKYRKQIKRRDEYECVTSVIRLFAYYVRIFVVCATIRERIRIGRTEGYMPPIPR